MGLKFPVRRQKLKHKLQQQQSDPSVTQSAPPILSTQRRCSNAPVESVGNSIISSRADYRPNKKKNKNSNNRDSNNAVVPPFRPNFAKVETTPSQKLHPLGFSPDATPASGTTDEWGHGYNCGGGDNISSFGGGDSKLSDIVSADLSKGDTVTGIELSFEPRRGVKKLEIPMASSSANINSNKQKQSNRNSANSKSNGSSGQQKRAAQEERRGKHYRQPSCVPSSGLPLDPPKEENVKKEEMQPQGNLQLKAGKQSLRAAMRREINRHRGGAGGQQSNEEVGRGQTSTSNRVRSKGGVDSSSQAKSKGSDGLNSLVAGHKSKSKDGGTAGVSRGGDGNTNTTDVIRGNKATNVATAAVAVGAVGAVGASRMRLSLMTSRSRSKSYGTEDEQTLDDATHEGSYDDATHEGSYDDATHDGSCADFPKSAVSIEDDDESLHASSFCSFGESLDGYEEEGNNDRHTADYTDDGTCDEGTCNEDDEETIDSYIDDATMESYLSDEESCVSRKSVDPPANDSTWAKWLGIGGRGGDQYESVISESVISPEPSEDGSSHSGTSTLVTRESADDEDETVAESMTDESISNDSKLSAKEEFNKEVAAKEKKATEKAAEKESDSNHETPQQQTMHDREGEGRSMVGEVPEVKSVSKAKPVRRVPILKKKWKKLKAPPASPVKKKDDASKASAETPATVSTKGSSYRENSNESSTVKGKNAKNADASKVSTETPATISTKESSKESPAVQGKNAKNATVNTRLWDTDERQRDIYCPKHGGVENLTIRQYTDVPTPSAPDHILVKVMASTISPGDYITRIKGDPNTRPSPAVPGFHIVGQVHAIGAEVDSTTFRRGARVAALLPEGGGNAKYISIPKRNVIMLPENANEEDIICLVANYMVAYQCLKLSKKDGAPLTNANVLITGGSGPVGQALVELALREGAKVYATAHKMHKEHLTNLGTKWFGVKPNQWLPDLEGKMDVVIDSLCVDGYESSYRALTPDGILVCNTSNYSALQHQNDSTSGVAFDDNGANAWWSSVKAKYVWNRAIFYDLNESYEENPKMFGHELHYLICKLQRGEISPKVAGRVSLNQVPKAQKLVEKGLPNGTVVCLPWKKLDPKQTVKVEKSDLHRQ